MAINPVNNISNTDYSARSRWGMNVRAIGGGSNGEFGGGAPSSEVASGYSFRAVDNLPKAQMTAYHQNLEASNGGGETTWSLIA